MTGNGREFPHFRACSVCPLDGSRSTLYTGMSSCIFGCYAKLLEYWNCL